MAIESQRVRLLREHRALGLEPGAEVIVRTWQAEEWIAGGLAELAPVVPSPAPRPRAREAPATNRDHARERAARAARTTQRARALPAAPRRGPGRPPKAASGRGPGRPPKTPRGRGR
jgi:hypothetical protein